MNRRHLFVISDLHLGGRPDVVDDSGNRVPGTSICSSAHLLSGFIDWIGEKVDRDHECEIEIVLNGDVFDYLCELEEYRPLPQNWSTDEELALKICTSLQTRYPSTSDNEHSAKGSPLRALRDFLSIGGKLTILIGNHDVELTFPQVRHWLKEQLNAGGKKFDFIYDGEAYTVGDVLIEHGNRYDKWNVVDHDRLRRARSLMSRGLHKQLAALPLGMRFVPPAGSILVAHVYNNLKQQYRFLDLLKPETEAVVPLLLTLCPPSVQILSDLVKRLPWISQRLLDTRGSASGRPANGGYLSSTDAAVEPKLKELLEVALGPGAREFFPEAFEVREVKERIQLSWEAGAPDSSLYDDLQALGTKLSKVGTFATLLAPATEKQTLQRLHKALLNLPSGRTFDLRAEDTEYISAAKRILTPGRFKAVVFGHTHLPKYIQISDENNNSQGLYINTGTWANTMRVPKACLQEDFYKSRDALRAFARNLAANEYGAYLQTCACYAELELNGGKLASAHLWQFKSVDAPREQVEMPEVQ